MMFSLSLSTWASDTCRREGASEGQVQRARGGVVVVGLVLAATAHHHPLRRTEQDEPNVFFIFERIIALGGSTYTLASPHTHLAARYINFSAPPRDAGTRGWREGERGRVRGSNRSGKGQEGREGQPQRKDLCFALSAKGCPLGDGS